MNKWKRIEEAFEKDEFGMPSVNFATGTVLRRRDGTLRLLGDDIAGGWTTGCVCCAEQWKDGLEDVTHFAVIDWKSLLDYPR